MTDDGAEYTGIVLVERNSPVMMVALRVGTAQHRDPRPQVYAATYERSPWSAYDDDGPFR